MPAPSSDEPPLRRKQQGKDEHESLDQNGRVTTGIVPLPPFPLRPPAPATPDEYLDPRKLQTFSDTPSAEWRTFDGVTAIVDHAFDWGSLTSTTSWRQYDSLNHTEEDGTNRADLYVDSQNTEGNKSLYQEFKEPLYAPPPLLSRMVEAGLLGRKTGRGFYEYSR